MHLYICIVACYIYNDTFPMYYKFVFVCLGIKCFMSVNLWNQITLCCTHYVTVETSVALHKLHLHQFPLRNWNCFWFQTWVLKRLCFCCPLPMHLPDLKQRAVSISGVKQVIKALVNVHWANSWTSEVLGPLTDLSGISRSVYIVRRLLAYLWTS